MHREPRSFHKSTKPGFVNVCVWLFCKVNTVKSFYSHFTPSSPTDRADERQRAAAAVGPASGCLGRLGKRHRGKGAGQLGRGRALATPWPGLGRLGLLCPATRAGRGCTHGCPRRRAVPGSAGPNELACEAKEPDGWPGEEDAARSRNGRRGSSARWQWWAWRPPALCVL